MITKIVRAMGILTIVLFAVASIFFSIAQRDMEDPRIRKIMSYPSFFEDRFYDIRMLKTLDPKSYDDRLVLAKIDEYTLEHLGRWPFSRIHWAKFMQQMKNFGAKVVAFDVFFVEPEKACTAEESPDIFLNSTLDEYVAAGGKAILPYSLNVDGWQSDREFKEIPDALYNFIMDTKQSEGLNLKKMTISKDAYPNSIFTNGEVGLGHIEATGDADGIYRHYQVLGNADDLYFPSFSLLAYQFFTDDKPVLELLTEGDATLKIGKGSIKLNHKGEAKVRWLGDHKAFPAASVYDIIKAAPDDKEMMKLLNGKIVFVGSTAYGAHDLRHTPVDPQMPGIYFHMNMTHMLLEGKFFRSQADSTLYSWLMLLIGTFVMIVVQLFGRPILDLIVVVILAGGMYYLDTYHLLPQGYEIKLFFCLFSVISCYSWNTFLNFYLSNKDKAFLKSAFGSYISPELIDEMYASGEPPQLGGTEGLITAYFTDIQSFSTFSEKLTAPQLVELLNEYLTAMTDILLEERGTLDKYEGDAIIAFFGAPMHLEDHAVRSCRVAVRMQTTLGVLREKWQGEGDKWPEIVHNMRMRIGINSGNIVTGNMGSSQRMNYTMMGDSVNLAARLEEAAKQYGIFTQVSQDTMKLTEGHFVARELDTIRVVGKSEPVTTYDLMGIEGETDEACLNLKKEFEDGLELYKNMKWDEAIAKFTASLEWEHKRFPELKDKKNPSLVYLERCEMFKQDPPPADWDGVFTLTSK